MISIIPILQRERLRHRKVNFLPKASQPADARWVPLPSGPAPFYQSQIHRVLSTHSSFFRPRNKPLPGCLLSLGHHLKSPNQEDFLCLLLNTRHSPGPILPLLLSLSLITWLVWSLGSPPTPTNYQSNKHS